jgi:hypothetical protein
MSTKDTTLLNYDVVRKIINRFLTEKRISKANWLASPYAADPFTKEELAQKIGITVEDITKILSLTQHPEIINHRVSAALNHLYCNTKWETGMDYKGK